MPSNCCQKIICNTLTNSQQALLSFLINQYNSHVNGHFQDISTFLANSNTGNYNSVINNVNALIASLDSLSSFNTSNFTAIYRIVIANAEGAIVYDSTSSSNSLANYNSATISTSTTANYGLRKPIQILNTNELVLTASQIKPARSHGSQPTTWITEARIATRTGTPGIANTGFLLLSIEVDILSVPF
jgi:hypothetical protein